ncbi:hypothetical protein AMTRI_Chr01g104970 [Amborella trichopoda]
MKITFSRGKDAVCEVLKVMKKAFFEGKGSGKTMRAPGRPFCISRSTFASNPKAYFRKLYSDGL